MEGYKSGGGRYALNNVRSFQYNYLLWEQGDTLNFSLAAPINADAFMQPKNIHQ